MAEDLTPLELVLLQAEDHGLWFQAETCAEAYLQAALRKLHSTIEATLSRHRFTTEAGERAPGEFMGAAGFDVPAPQDNALSPEDRAQMFIEWCALNKFGLQGWPDRAYEQLVAHIRQYAAPPSPPPDLVTWAREWLDKPVVKRQSGMVGLRDDLWPEEIDSVAADLALAVSVLLKHERGKIVDQMQWEGNRADLIVAIGREDSPLLAPGDIGAQPVEPGGVVKIGAANV